MKNDILQKVAQSYGVSRETVEYEIRKALEEAMKSTDTIAQSFWKQVAPDGVLPKTEKVIEEMAQLIKSN